MPDILPAAETLAKGVKHIATYFVDAIAERRKAFDDDEAGDYLRCAGSDGLAEALCVAEAERDVYEPTVCYFCNRPTDRTVVCNADFDTEYVCEKCTVLATSPAAPRLAAVPSTVSVTAPVDEGPAEDCDIAPSPSAGQPTCKNCARPIELLIDTHPRYGRAGVWLHVGGDGRCKSTYASPE